ncbi:MAG: Hsp70 family protein, partial [Polyangiaceae bacterium]
VAVGAAIQAGVLSGDVKDMVLLDVTPLSLGMETLGGVMTVMIPRNTTLPSQKKETFTTAAGGQDSVEIHVLQGERTESKLNRTLGKFQLQGILPAPRGVPKIKVTFDIDANGILSVTAKDTATGKDQKITLTASSGLSEAEIQRMVKEAADHETEDKLTAEKIQRRNELDTLCYTLEKTFKEHEAKLQPADIQSLQALVAEGRAAFEKQDDDEIKTVSERLKKEAQRVGSAIYQDAGATAAAGETPHSSEPTKGPKSGIVDAEFDEAHGGP